MRLIQRHFWVVLDQAMMIGYDKSKVNRFFRVCHDVGDRKDGMNNCGLLSFFACIDH